MMFGRATYLTTAAAIVAGGLLWLAPARVQSAGELTSVGLLDQDAVAGIAAFRTAATRLQASKTKLDAEYAQAMKGVVAPADQQRVAARFSRRFAERQEALLGPVFRRARAAIAEVAAKRRLSVVVDRRIVVVGGVDITKDVVRRLAQTRPFAQTPPSLPPSSIGYVDEQVVNAVPKVKDANDRFAVEQKKIQAQAIDDAKDASDADRQKIAERARNQEKDKQREIIAPAVDDVNRTIADVAQKQGLSLVVDKAAIMIGGRDVTTSVADALK